MNRKYYYGGDTNFANEEDDKYDKNAKHLDQKYGLLYHNSKQQCCSTWLDLILFSCQIIAFAQIIALVMLFTLSFNQGNAAGVSLHTNTKSTRVPEIARGVSGSKEQDAENKPLISQRAVDNAYTLRFESSDFSLGDIVHYVPKYHTAPASPPSWLARAQVAKCTAKVVDISSASGSKRYLVVVHGWSGDSAQWLLAEELQLAEGGRVEGGQDCPLPAALVAREVYIDEMYSICSDKIQEFCMHGFGTHDATAGNGNFDCYATQGIDDEGLSPDFYRAQNLMAEKGYCPYTTHMKWVPDSVTHPLCSSSLAASKNQVVTSRTPGRSSGLRSVEATNAMLFAKQAAVDSSGRCPSHRKYQWQPDELMFPQCTSALRRICYSKKAMKQAACHFPPVAPWNSQSKALVAALQDSEEILGSGACPFSGLTLWAPLGDFYDGCSDYMTKACSDPNGADLCRYDFQKRYAVQVEAAVDDVCPHPSAAFRWRYYDTKKQLAQEAS